MRTFILIPLAVLFSLPSSAEEAGVTEKARQAAQQLKLSASQTFDKFKESELVPLREQIVALNAALRAKDFAKGKEAASRIDGQIHSDIVTQVVEILRLHDSEGIQKAEAVVAEHLKRPDLREADRKAFQQVMDELASASNHDIAAVAGGIVYIALEDKWSHSAAVPSAMVQVLVQSLPIGKRDPKPAAPPPPPAAPANAPPAKPTRE